MSTDTLTKPSLGGLKKRRRKTVTMDNQKLVETGPLVEGQAIPRLVQPARSGVDLVAWAQHNRDRVEEMLLEHRALLFRDFGIDEVERFEAFVAATSEGDPLEYKDRSTPRHTVGEGGGVYVSTIYPRDQRIKPHNEGTYWMRFAKKIYFCCLTAAEKGGETPIADVRKVWERLDPEVRREFLDKGVMYVRNYREGVGLPWQEVYQTDDRAEVEAYCGANDIRCEWRPDGLRTRQVRPAVRQHPDTGETVWFNHAAFFHITSQEPETRDALLAQFDEEDLPYNTYYGDGTPIAPEVVASIRDAYAAETTMFRWQQGDVMFLDNLSVAHAREPYEGAREIVVAMCEPTSGGEG